MRRYFKELLFTFTFTPSFFQSMINRWTSLVKGGVDFVLLSLSTSPHPTRLPPSTLFPNPLFNYLTQICPLIPACFGQSHRAATGVGSNLLVDIVPPFIFFNNVSCCWCPHVLPLCISRMVDFVFGFRYVSFFLLYKFGLSSEDGARMLVCERKPHIVLIVWFFFVSILMRWNPSCRIFCIARIVRQWEDGGAIWREFSYWMEPQQLPIGCHII